jgi:hypothetical protein
MTLSPDGCLPSYWDLLDEEDRAQYHRLREEFFAGNFRHTRNARLEQFDTILDKIRQYAERGDENDWRRFLVCGVCWLDNAIAINTRQLRLLVAKCKSSINGSLQKMGYTAHVSHSESWKILFPRIPALQGHFPELRQWSVRSRPGVVLTGTMAPMFAPLIPGPAPFHVIPFPPAQVFVSPPPVVPPKLRRWSPVPGIRTFLSPLGNAASK